MYSTIHCNALCNTQLIDFSIKRTNEKLSEKGSLPVSIYIGLPYRDKIHFGFVGWSPEAIGDRPAVKGEKKSKNIVNESHVINDDNNWKLRNQLLLFGVTIYYFFRSKSKDRK
jgi:hypothetical protein